MVWGERRQKLPFFAFALVLEMILSRQNYGFRGGRELSKVAQIHRRPFQAQNAPQVSTEIHQNPLLFTGFTVSFAVKIN
jgi:hypothetical protein